MTIEKTRELMGSEIESLTDIQVLELIQITGEAIDALFDLFIKKNLTAKHEGVQKE